MNAIPSIAIQCAALVICVAGACVAIKPLRGLGWRLLLAGGVIASADPIIRTQLQSDSYLARLEQIIAWIGVAGVIAAVFGARHLATRFIMPAIALLAVALVLPMVQPLMALLMRWWWLVLAILIAPFIAMFIVADSMERLRGHALGLQADNSFRRFFIRVFDRLNLGRRPRRHRDRHIGNAFRPRQKTGRDRRT